MWSTHLLATWFSCILLKLLMEHPRVLRLTWHGFGTYVSFTHDLWEALHLSLAWHTFWWWLLLEIEFGELFEEVDLLLGLFLAYGFTLHYFTRACGGAHPLEGCYVAWSIFIWSNPTSLVERSLSLWFNGWDALFGEPPVPYLEYIGLMRGCPLSSWSYLSVDDIPHVFL